MLTKANLIKFLIGYLVIFYSLAGIGFWALHKHYKNNFSEEKLEKMLVTQSKFRDITNDLCTYYIYGDPVDAEEQFTKVNFYCSNKRMAKNTLSFKAFKDRTFSGVIKEYARIIGFDPKIVLDNKSEWKCYVEQKEVRDKSININDKVTIDCISNDWKINQIYSNLK